MDANLKTKDCLLHIRNHPHLIIQSTLLDNDVPKCTQCPIISLFIVLPTIHSNMTFGSQEPIHHYCMSSYGFSELTQTSQAHISV